MRFSYPDSKGISSRIKYGGVRRRKDADRSAEILILLALAIESLEQLKSEQGIAFPSIAGRPLLVSSLERAYREAVQLRIMLPRHLLTNKTNWPIKISKFGNASEE